MWRTKFNGNQHIFVRLSLDTHQAAVSHLIFKPSNFDYDLPISVGQVGVFISYFRPVSEEIQHIALLKSLQNHHSLPTSTMILWVLSNKIPHNSKTTKTTTPTRISFTYHLFFTSQLIVVQKNININNITSNFRKLKKHGRLLPFHRSGFFFGPGDAVPLLVGRCVKFLLPLRCPPGMSSGKHDRHRAETAQVDSPLIGQ